MSGIGLMQMLKSINIYEVVEIEDEFGLSYGETSVENWLVRLGDDEVIKSITIDYIRTNYDGNITIGLNRSHRDVMKRRLA